METVDGHWVHDLDPVIFQLTETLAVRWYGVAYVAGFLAAVGLLWWYRRRGLSPLSPALLENFFLYVMVGVIAGGRLGYFLLYAPGDLLANPLVLLAVWEGGMASHGGFAGVFVAVWWFAQRHGLSPFALGDLVVTVVPPGLFFGRIANFINGQLWGKVSEVSWSVVFPKSAPPGTPLHLIPPRHPSQLYEAALEGLVLFVYVQARFWGCRTGKRGSASVVPSRTQGHLTAEFLIAYSLLRCVGELYREPDASLIFGFSRGIFYSMFLLAFGIAMLLFVRRRRLTSRDY